MWNAVTVSEMYVVLALFMLIGISQKAHKTEVLLQQVPCSAHFFLP